MFKCRRHIFLIFSRPSVRSVWMMWPTTGSSKIQCKNFLSPPKLFIKTSQSQLTFLKWSSLVYVSRASLELKKKYDRRRWIQKWIKYVTNQPTNKPTTHPTRFLPTNHPTRFLPTNQPTNQPTRFLPLIKHLPLFLCFLPTVPEYPLPLFLLFSEGAP